MYHAAYMAACRAYPIAYVQAMKCPELFEGVAPEQAAAAAAYAAAAAQAQLSTAPGRESQPATEFCAVHQKQRLLKHLASHPEAEGLYACKPEHTCK